MEGTIRDCIKQLQPTTVSAALKASINSITQSNFEKLLIPAYQSATQSMFKQMQSAFQQGLQGLFEKFDQRISTLTAGVDKLSAVVDLHVQRLNNVDDRMMADAKSVCAEIQRQQKEIISTLLEFKQQLSDNKKTLEASPSSSNKKDNFAKLKSFIDQDLQQSDFEAAFIKVILLVHITNTN